MPPQKPNNPDKKNPQQDLASLYSNQFDTYSPEVISNASVPVEKPYNPNTPLTQKYFHGMEEEKQIQDPNPVLPSINPDKKSSETSPKNKNLEDKLVSDDSKLVQKPIPRSQFSNSRKPIVVPMAVIDHEPINKTPSKIKKSNDLGLVIGSFFGVILTGTIGIMAMKYYDSSNSEDSTQSQSQSQENSHDQSPDQSYEDRLKIQPQEITTTNISTSDRSRSEIDLSDYIFTYHEWKEGIKTSRGSNSRLKEKARKICYYSGSIDDLIPSDLKNDYKIFSEDLDRLIQEKFKDNFDIALNDQENLRIVISEYPSVLRGLGLYKRYGRNLDPNNQGDRFVLFLEDKMRRKNYEENNRKFSESEPYRPWIGFYAYNFIADKKHFIETFKKPIEPIQYKKPLESCQNIRDFLNEGGLRTFITLDADKKNEYWISSLDSPTGNLDRNLLVDSIVEYATEYRSFYFENQMIRANDLRKKFWGNFFIENAFETDLEGIKDFREFQEMLINQGYDIYIGERNKIDVNGAGANNLRWSDKGRSVIGYDDEWLDLENLPRTMHSILYNETKNKFLFSESSSRTPLYNPTK